LESVFCRLVDLNGYQDSSRHLTSMVVQAGGLKQQNMMTMSFTIKSEVWQRWYLLISVL